jgi:phosphoserine phosphatase
MVRRLSIQYFKANKLEVINGVLTGELLGPVVDRAAKASALREFAALSGVEIENTVAIGDGANDLDMMAIAGLSIAFNAKPVVVEAADIAITEPSLSSVIDLINLQ